MTTPNAAIPWDDRRIITTLFDAEMRLKAARAVWVDTNIPGEVKDEILTRLAHIMRFRPAMVKRLPDEKKGEYLARHLFHRDLGKARLCVLTAYHFVHQAALMGDFLDHCGIDHEGGRLAGTRVAPPAPEKVTSSLPVLLSRHTPRDVGAYFATAGLANHGWHTVLWPHVDKLQEHATAESFVAPAEETREAESPALEDTRGFTTLDRLLIQAVVATASGTQGALSVDQVADVVEEIIHLNSDRHQSYFHRGFLSALLDLEVESSFVEENTSRRSWLMAGQIMALTRRKNWDALMDLFQARDDDLQSLLQSREDCATMCGPQIFNAYKQKSRYAEAAGAVPPALAARLGTEFLHHRIGDVEELLRHHRPIDARLILELILSSLEGLADEDPLPGRVLVHLQRRMAQCYRGEGRFDDCRELLAKLLQLEESDKPAIHVDLGLIKGHFRWISEVLVPGDGGDELAAMRSRISAGRDQFERALSLSGGKSPNAHYVLGVLELLSRNYAKAEMHLEQAYSGASHDVSAYRPAGLYERIQLYYALAILACFDEHRVPVALQMLQTIERNLPVQSWPSWLLKEASEIISMGNTDCALLLEWLSEKAPGILAPHLHDIGLLKKSALLQRALAQSAATLARRNVDDLWKDNTTLLEFHLGTEDHAGAGHVLDRLEELAFSRSDIRELFAEFLITPGNYRPVWSEEDALFVSSRLYQAAGQFEPSYELLKHLFFRYRADGHYQEAEGVLDQINQLCLPLERTDEVTRYSVDVDEQAFKPEDQIGAALQEHAKKGRPIRLLLVGGNETQARYDGEIVEYFRRGYPVVEVAFEHSGWGSNWIKYFERIQARIADYEGLVLMRYMRTNLGRSLRALANQENRCWFACTGSGRQFLQRTLLQAAYTIAEREAAAIATNSK
ncbi:MAG: hypothetical protein IT369_00430 [Candidatus Latescibacteria bacterium]|nr:hypothetical protein [Candidatus Latescibacterota bacterium]